MRLPRFKLLLLLILWRLSNVIIVTTVHVPDEYWQSLEVAHRLAFGYGYLTWEWTTMIRSYMYPFLISILYRILATLSLDYVLLLTLLPRVFQAILVAYADYRFYKWTKNEWMLICLCLNWYWYYCATRTLINSVEAACTIIALSMYPLVYQWRESRERGVKFLWIVGFLCMARPTAAIMWLPLCLHHIRESSEKIALLGRYILICSTCAVISVLIDCYCYGTYVITPWKFFQVNVLGNVGSTYGTKHMLWYIYAGLPVLLGLHLLPFLFACWLVRKRPALFPRESIMLVVIGWTLLIYSLLPHKEFRFILPLLPLFIYTSYLGYLRFLNLRLTDNVYKGLIMMLVYSNVMPGLLLSTYHQRGTLTIMEILRDEITRANHSSDTLILTPCHSTPLYSHLHVNTPIRFLTCEPNLNNVEDYVDEADRFFANATIWLSDNYVNNREVTLPTYVIAFDNVASEMSEFLRAYRPIAKEFYTYFPERNYGKNILLYKHT